ncbi:MAG: Inositol-1-monophosphatase [Candidatus Falkowbacteria bacterium GW2011_GWF2_39_8]|uniref:Inositol-1-monophosphatase n=1 Tax=Candidatus Falkowbacteria bacterium GW2011_GWF2_39_8 TaxID=1618642 RepID=A0A0G0Q788_9BACT|nr:MAG: Inositol-1-monophosphatase [Candidatus Falkowbacteria bacterium GW2011_GWF2_39_8]
MENLNKIKATATRAAKRAGEQLLKEFFKFDRSKIELKSKFEILTKCDLISERIILNEIKKAFPTHAILSEESGSNSIKSEYLWIIDPIDGSTNFSFHNPLWSISIGLAKDNQLICGLVYVPILKELYWAEKNKGAFCNGKKIKVSNLTDGNAVHTFCHGGTKGDIKTALAYYKKQKLDKLDCRQLGSAAIELAFVASGRTESIMIPGVRIWDIAAGVLLVREAGGQVTDFSGKPWQLEFSDTIFKNNETSSRKDILASNCLVHDEILKVIKKI